MNHKILILFLFSFFSLQSLAVDIDERAIRKELEFLYKNNRLTAHQLMQEGMSLNAILDRDIEIMQKHRDHLQIKIDNAKTSYKPSIVSFFGKAAILGLAAVSATAGFAAIIHGLDAKLRWNYLNILETAFGDLSSKNIINYLDYKNVLKQPGMDQNVSKLYRAIDEDVLMKRNNFFSAEKYAKSDIRNAKRDFEAEISSMGGLGATSIILGFCTLKIHTYLKKYFATIDSSLEKWHNHIEQDNAIIIELKNLKTVSVTL